MKWLYTELILMFLSVNIGLSQDFFLEANQVYGRDPMLYNGKRYTYILPTVTQGTQFFPEKEFQNGAVTIKDVEYPVSHLNYDIYNQQVILSYENEARATDLIELSQAWMDSFRLGNQFFQFISYPGIQAGIYQVIHSGDLQILYHWTKTLKLDIGYGSNQYIFSDPQRRSYLKINDLVVEYRSNRSFVAAFDDQHQVPVRKFLQANHLNVKKASDRSMADLLTYCGGLLK